MLYETSCRLLACLTEYDGMGTVTVKTKCYLLHSVEWQDCLCVIGKDVEGNGCDLFQDSSPVFPNLSSMDESQK